MWGGEFEKLYFKKLLRESYASSLLAQQTYKWELKV